MKTIKMIRHYIKARLSRWISSLLLKVSIVPPPLRSSGRLFQQNVIALPNVFVLLCGITKREEPEDLCGLPGS